MCNILEKKMDKNTQGQKFVVLNDLSWCRNLQKISQEKFLCQPMIFGKKKPQTSKLSQLTLHCHLVVRRLLALPESRDQVTVTQVLFSFHARLKRSACYFSMLIITHWRSSLNSGVIFDNCIKWLHTSIYGMKFIFLFVFGFL